MNYEKLYKDARQRAKHALDCDRNNLASTDVSLIYSMFPELKGGEDERIREQLCDFLRDNMLRQDAQYFISWLEGQGQVKESHISQHESKTREENNEFLTNEDERIKETLKGVVKSYSAFINGQWQLGDFTVNRLMDWLEKHGEKVTNINGEDYGIDGLYHAIRILEITVGEVTGYQSDDGILEHKTAINAVKELYEKQGEKKDFTFKSIPRLLEMVPPTDRAKSYCEKLRDSLQAEGYHADSKIVGEHLKRMNGEAIAAATSDENVDKPEPKFKVGDWFVNNNRKDVFLIKSINTNGYCTLEDIKGNIISPCLPPCESDSHIWTIEDAKDGDVLTNGEFIVIFKQIIEPKYKQHIEAYIGLDLGGNIQITSESWLLGIDKAMPATKEQRDLLFQKMEEVGCEWDAEKKRIKTIEQKPADKIEPKFKVGDWIVFNGLILHIDEIVNGYYRTTSIGDGIHNSYDWDIDNAARLWTIQEAKDGDVLVCNINKAEIGGDVEKLPNMTPTIFIYQNVVKDSDYIHSYCSLYDENFLVLPNTMYYNAFVCNIQPATKEQHDLLFQKMKEAGYKWDSTYKKLVIL